MKTSLLPISTCRIGASTSRFYSVVVVDARNITFDGATSLCRGFIEREGGRRARWSILDAKAKECRYSYYNNLNISVDTTTPQRPRT